MHQDITVTMFLSFFLFYFLKWDITVEVYASDELVRLVSRTIYELCQWLDTCVGCYYIPSFSNIWVETKNECTQENHPVWCKVRTRMLSVNHDGWISALLYNLFVLLLNLTLYFKCRPIIGLVTQLDILTYIFYQCILN